MTPGDINQHHIISKMFNARKAASILECAPDYISRLCREGKLSGVRHQGQWFVEPQSLKRFQAERAVAKEARSEALASERRQETRAFVYASKGPVGKLAERIKERMPKLELGKHTVAALVLSVLLGSSVLASGTLMPKFNAQETPAALGRIESPFFSTTLSSFGDIFKKISALFAPKSIAIETPEIIRTPAGAVVPSAPAVAVNVSTTVATTTQALSHVTNTYPTTYITNSADLTQYVTYDFLGDQLERVFDAIADNSGGGGTLTDFSSLTVSDIPDLSGIYLSLSGGTVTSTTTLTGLALADIDCSAYNNGGALTTDSSGNVICSADDSTAGSGSPGGLNTYVQYNDAGSFGGDAGFTYNASQDRLTVSYASTTALTATTASTTNLIVSGISSSLLKTVNGVVTAAVAGTDYQAAGNYATFTYPFPSNATTTQIAFNGGATFVGATTTALAVTGSTTISSVLNVGGQLNANVAAVIASTTLVGNTLLTNATTTNLFISELASSSALRTLSATINYASTTNITSSLASTTNLNISGITSGSTQCLQINSSGTVSGTGSACGSGAGSITAIGPLGQTQSGTTITFATSTNGSDFTITATGDTITFNLPIASASNTGKLSATDWVMFNAKLGSTSIDTSAELAALVVDETGSGALVFGTNATLASTTLTGNTLLTNATSTTFAITAISGALLKTTAGGSVVPAVAGTDYQAAGNYATFSYPFPSNATTTLIAFSGGLSSASTTLTGPFVFANATGTNATTTNLYVSGLASSTELRALTSTINYASTTAITATTASTTNLVLSGISSSLLKTVNGVVTAAVAGVDYAAAGASAFEYPFPSNATTTQIAFNGGLTAVGATTTALAVTGSSTISSVLNVGGVLNANGGVVGNVTGNASTATALETGRTINGVTFDGTANITITAASSTLLANSNTFSGSNVFSILSSASTTLTGPFVFANATGTNATTTNLYVSGLASSTELRALTGTINYASTTALTVSGSLYGAGLSDCSTSADKLLWNNGIFSCGTDQSGTGGANDGNWLFFNGSGIRPATTSNQVLVGATATSSLAAPLAKFGVVGGASLDSATTTALAVTGSTTISSVLNVGGQINAASGLIISGAITSSALNANVLPYASSTALTVSGTGYFGTASTTNLVISGLGASAGQCLTTNASGDITTQSCGSFSYPFPSNATTTLIAFTGGLTSASTTLTGPFIFANATGTNATTTSFFATTASSTNLFSNSATLNAATIGSLTLNNALGVAQGGTGSTTLGGLLSGNGTSIYSSATTSASCSSGVSCSAFTVLGAGPVSITNSGVTSLAGTANQITASASTGAITLSLPNHVIFPSSFQAAAASTTNATTTNLAITDVTSSLLKTLSNGSVAAAVAGVDYATLSTVASAYPFQGANNSTSTLVGFTGGLSSASTTLTGPFVFANATGTNATTTALAAANLVVSGNATLASTTLTGNTLLTHATTTNFAITGVTSALLKTLSNGSVAAAVAGVDYATLSTVASAYPFQGTGNSTSTLTQFNGGLTAYASTTIGAGGQTTGLTISGGATTTGSAYITGTLGVGVNVSGSNKLDVNGSTRICANNAGCVGNTGAGDYSLSLQNNGTTNWLEILNSGGVNKGVFFGLTGNNFEQWNYQGGDIIFYTDTVSTSGKDRFRITNAGNVSVGSSTPFSKFSVHLRDGDTNLNAFAIGSSTASATTTLLRVDNTGALSLVGNITSTSGSASVLPYASTTALTVSGSFYGAGLATCNTATDKVLWADGQFSCGTDLNTGGGGNTFSFSNNYGVLAAATSSAIWAQSGIFASSTSHFVSLDAINATSTYLTASVANFGGSGGTTTITANGNVGLGSTTPSQKLTVVGGTILQTASGDPTLAATITTSNNSYQTVIAGHYAYTADFAGGLRITDITDPKNPAAVASYAYNGGSSAAVSIAVAGKYAYIGDSSAGLIIFDVSNPASPTIVSSTALLDAPWSMAVSGRYLYVADGDDQVMYIIDISNPAAPTVAGTFAPGGGSAQPYAVAVEGKYAYLGDIGNSRVYVVDISNPAVPVTTASYTGGGGLAPVGLYAAGRYLYVADAGLGFYSLDVSNAGATPTLVGSYGSGSTYYGVAVAGLYAYVGDNGGNVVVLNLSRPTAPTLVGTYATGATPLHMAVSGKYAYVSTDGGGVKVIDINGASLPAATIGALDTSMLNVGDDLRVGNNLYAGGSLNVGISGIYSRGTISAYVASSTQTNPVVASFMGGNVGIGSSTPSATLSLLTSQTAGQAAYINGNSLTSGIGLGITVNSNAMTSTGRAFAIVDNAFGSLSTPNFEIDRYGQTGIRTFGILSSDTSLTVGTGFDAFKGIVVKGNSVTQTGNLQEWQNSAGVVLGAVTATGRVGIGSSTPAALFAISDNTANGNTTAFLISSSTASATTTLLSVSNQGNLTVAGSSTVASVLNAGGAINAASTLNIGGIITSTATAANTLPYASTTAVTVSGTASTTALVVSNLGSGAGNCLTPTSVGTITTQTCAAFAYPFPSNATSTLLTFSGGISVGGTLTVSGGRVDYSAAATSTIVNNTAYAWTLATSTTATPLINVTTTTGTETVTIGVAGSDVLIGGVGAAANLVFEESSTIHGQGGNTLTFGTTGDKINFAVNVGFGTTTPLAAIHADVTGTGDTAILGVGRNESFAGTVMGAASYRSASSAYYLFAGISDYHGTPDNEFLMRGDGNGFLDGSWSTPADFAEWTRVVGTTTDYQVGDLVAFATTSEFGPSDRRAALGTRGATPLGVVTLKPGVVGVSFDLSDDVTDAATGSTTKFVKTGSRTQKQMEEAYNAKMVALVGYTPIHVSTENGPLKSGDGITFSSIPGVGMKAGPGDSVVGYAFEEFDPEEGKMGTHDRELPTYDDSTTFKPMTTATTTPDGEDVWSGWVFAHVEKGYVPNLSLTDMLASTTAAMDDETRQEIDGFWTGLFGKIATWLGDASNGIANLFATTVTAETLNTNKLCVDDLCITKSELQTLLNNAGTSGAPPPLPQEEQGTTTPPIETPDDDSGTSTPPIDEPADEPTVETPPDEPTVEAPAEEPPSQEPAPEETEAPAEPVAGESGEQ